MIHAHADQPAMPHDLWTAWNLDPLLLVGLLLAASLYAAGLLRSRRRPGRTLRTGCFAGALAALAVALVSPLDALSGALASAHMVQHLLLTLVAAPLLALSDAGTMLVRGSPQPVRRATGRWRRRLRLRRRDTPLLRHPVVAWLLYVGTLWFWHGAVPYDAALRYEPVHVLSHTTYLLTGVLFWRVLVESGGRTGSAPGVGVLLAFGAAMQSVFLAALLTFAQSSWYSGYADTTRPWGMEPLVDQQLAGAIMWLPGGLIYLATALTLLVSWIGRSSRGDPAGAVRPEASTVG